MSFHRKLNGKIFRHKKAVIDCSKDEIIVEQNHKSEVDINNIIKRHGLDLIQQTALLQTPSYMMDDIPTNDFTEAMNIIAKAQQTFENMPSAIRKKFNNQPAEFMDFIHNPANTEEMVKMGLAQRPPKTEPVEVILRQNEVPNPAESDTGAPNAGATAQPSPVA